MSEFTTKQRINQGLTSEKANLYNEQISFLDNFINNKTTSINEEIVTNPDKEKENQTNTVIPSQDDQETLLLNALGLKKTNVNIEIIYNPEQAPSFSVLFKPISVSVNDDAVFFIINNAVTIKPPKLVPIKIKINDNEYNVIYTGNVIKTNKVQMITMLRVTEN